MKIYDQSTQGGGARKWARPAAARVGWTAVSPCYIQGVVDVMQPVPASSRKSR